VDLLVAAGVGQRATREGAVYRGIELRFAGQSHRIDLYDLTEGHTITVYAQHEVITHRFHGESPFHHKLQLAELDNVVHFRAAATNLAENYVGLPLDIALD